MDGNPHETQKGEVKKKKKEERREEEEGCVCVSPHWRILLAGKIFSKAGQGLCVY